MLFTTYLFCLFFCICNKSSYVIKENINYIFTYWAYILTCFIFTKPNNEGKDLVISISWFIIENYKWVHTTFMYLIFHSFYFVLTWRKLLRNLLCWMFIFWLNILHQQWKSWFSVATLWVFIFQICSIAFLDKTFYLNMQLKVGGIEKGLFGMCLTLCADFRTIVFPWVSCFFLIQLKPFVLI